MIKFNKYNMTYEQIAHEIVENIAFRLITEPICHMSLKLGVYGEINELVNKIYEIANNRYIDISIEYDDLLIWSSQIDIIAKYSEKALLLSGNMIDKFLIAEKYFYNKIIKDKIFVFDFKFNNLNKLYILHALQTAFYHAGLDEAFVMINGIRYRVEPLNYYDIYLEKKNKDNIVSLKEMKYRKKIKAEHTKNFIKFIEQ